MITVNLLLNIAVATVTNCELATPPASAGETQAHGVILYIYPRTHGIGTAYNGCQNQWFFDDDHYRKLSVVHYRNGIISAYDNIKINGDIGYHCEYEDGLLASNNDDRCPESSRLMPKTYQAGCYSRSELNASDSYDVAFSECELR